MLSPLALLAIAAAGAVSVQPVSVQPASVPARGGQQVLLTVDRTAMVHLSAQSPGWTRCELVDQLQGPFLESGTAGRSSCDVDALLDPGPYLLRLESPKKGKGQGVRTKEEFAAALKEANSKADQFGKIKEVNHYSHAGVEDGPIFHAAASGQGTQFSKEELAALEVNWADGASARFFGCNTGQRFAQQSANARRVSTFGFASSGYFSSKESERKDFGSEGPLYLVNAHGGKHEPIQYLWERLSGGVPALPMVKKEPKKESK